MWRVSARVPLVAVALCMGITACSEPPPPPATRSDAGPPIGGADSGVGDPDVGAPATCDAVPFRGDTYDCCDAAALCDVVDITHRFACCEFDIELCEVECEPDGGPIVPPGVVQETCMSCHNGAGDDEAMYAGPGLINPHPFPPSDPIACTTCHGGDGQGSGKAGSHVAPPPMIGDEFYQQNDPTAAFNRRTQAGIDRLTPDPYMDAAGKTWSNLDYLQFINPGDLRVVSAGRGCGMTGCHGDQHGQWVPRSVLATTTGLFSATRFLVGVDNRIPEYRGEAWYSDTAADSAPRAVEDPNFSGEPTTPIGRIGKLVEQPEVAQFNGPMVQNGNYLAANLFNHVIDDALDPLRPNRVRAGSPLEQLIDEQVNITCGNCHLYSAGDNNRYADFRSAGCTACHMEYSYDGRYRGLDPNLPRDEPADPDLIADGERSHVLAHQIRNVAKVVPGGAFVRGISDRACVGCHQGSNRTVLQYWGIRLDQNQDLTNALQYPANPDTFVDTAQDGRLYDQAVGNNTFNGREPERYILDEDYDGDGRDDTPPDVHYEAGLGCIDCHGSRDLHGGTAGDQESGYVMSRQDQATLVTCASCHGSVDAFAATAVCTTYTGESAQCVTDREGNPLEHVTKSPDGHYWLVSRLDGTRHYVPQTRDVTVQTNRAHPLTGRALYSPKASFAMGRMDGDPQSGQGPVQANPVLNSTPGFSHLDSMDCASCHASWTNNCIGCHLANAYDRDPNNALYSNITGERILLDETNADFVYQTPLAQYLGVNSRGKITKISPAEKVFWRFTDYQGQTSEVFVFSDRLGEGNNPARGGRNAFGASSMNQMAPHSIRGAVDGDNEGPTYCVGCHVNTGMVANAALMDQYAAFVAAYENQAFADIDFELLQTEIGLNPGNQRNSPFFVRMMAGLGTGLFLFDADGCPVNPLDENAARQNCGGQSPADRFADQVDAVAYDLDRIVEVNGVPNSSNAHPMQGLPRRDRRTAARAGAPNYGLDGTGVAGPLGAGQLQRLFGGADIGQALILDSYLDADGAPQGGAIDLLEQ